MSCCPPSYINVPSDIFAASRLSAHSISHSHPRHLDTASPQYQHCSPTLGMPHNITLYKRLKCLWNFKRICKQKIDLPSNFHSMVFYFVLCVTVNSVVALISRKVSLHLGNWRTLRFQVSTKRFSILRQKPFSKSSISALSPIQGFKWQLWIICEKLKEIRVVGSRNSVRIYFGSCCELRKMNWFWPGRMRTVPVKYSVLKVLNLNFDMNENCWPDVKWKYEQKLWKHKFESSSTSKSSSGGVAHRIEE